MCILAICLLLAYPLGSDLRCISDPQLKMQLRQQSLKPARVSTRFHSHAHLHPLRPEIAIELLRSLPVLESQLVQLSAFAIHPCNLLEGRVVICSYNDHLRLLSPELFGWFAPPKLTRVWEPTLLWNQLHYQPNQTLGQNNRWPRPPPSIRTRRQGQKLPAGRPQGCGDNVPSRCG